MYSNDKIALTEDMAMRLFGSTDVLGKEVKNYNDDTLTICAILSNLDHSNLSFGYWEQENTSAAGRMIGVMEVSKSLSSYVKELIR